MAYQVFDNGKPADCRGHKVHSSWNNSIFQTWDEAMNYANNWLGPYAGMVLIPNVPEDYSGYGDTIEIREISDNA